MMTTTSSSDTASLFTKFRFTNNGNGSSSGSSSGNKPPPLPPKDPVYLQQRYNAANRSAADIFSPDSPMSPTPPSREGVGQYGRHNTSSPTFNNQNPNSPFQMGAALESASMRNRSTTSLASQIPGQQLQPPLPGQQQPPTPGPSNINTGSSGNRNQSGSKKALTAFLKFPKKSPRSPNGPNGNGGDDEIPPPPQEDEGISMPWNFQHNIHVNETYDGLPPSWSTSLASAGFSEGEIGAIQARRIAGARSPPDLRYLYNERPLTPAAATAFNTPWGAAAVFTPPGSTASGSSSSQPPAQFATTPNGVPILTNPTPRSTSLRGGAATNPNTPGLSTSAPSGSFSDQQSRPPVPTIPHQLSNSSSNPSIRSAAGSVAGLRKPPPPTRRPPSPTEPGLNRSNGYAGYGAGNGYGHKPNQPSGSTFTSSDEDMSSHDHTNHTFANMNDSVAYRINPEDEPVPPVPSMHRPAMPGTRSRTNSNASQSRNGLGHGHSHSNPLVQYGHGHGHGPGHSASHSIAHSLSTSQMSHSGARSHEDTQLALHPLRIGSESELSVASGSTGGSGGHKGGAMTMGMVLMTKTMMGSKDSDAGTVLGVPVSVSGSVSTLEGYGNGLAGGGRKWKVVNDVGRRSEETAEDSGVGLGVGSNEGGESSAKSIEVVKEKEKTISKKPSLWGGKIPKTKSKAKLKPGAGEGTEDWVMPAVPGTQISPSSTNLLPGPSSSSSHGNHSVSGHASGSGTAFSSFKSSTSQLAASTSSSLAAAGSTLAGKSQLLVGAVWSGAGRVGGKLRGSIKDKSGRDKGKDKGDADDKGAEKGKDKAQGFFSPGSDEEFISMMPDMEDDVDKVPVAPVWQLYMRSAQELVDSQGQIKNDSQRLGVNGSGNHSSTSLVSKTSQGNLRGADPYGKLVDNKAATSSISLHSERSITQKLNAHPSSSQNSLHSLKPPSKGHKANASISSLNSIPEVASPTSPPEDTTISSSTHTANDSQTPESSPEKPRPPPTKRTAALPPRLSLHKSATSSDLTSWSQALLSGISLSGSGDDDFGSGLGLGLGFGMDKDKIKEGKGKSDKLDLSFSRDFLSLGARREEPEEYDDGDDDDDDERDEEGERQPQSAPASAATTAKPHNFAYHQQQASVSSVSSGSGPLKPPTTTSATAPTTPVQGRSRRSGAAHLPASKPAPPMALPPPPLPLGTKTSKLNGSQQVPHLRTDSLSKGKEGEDVKQHLPFSPLNLTKNSSGMGSLAGAMNGSQSQTQTQAVSNYVDPSSLLSPPPTAWTTHSPTAVGVNVISPSVHSSTGPDSAQLWNEIERMVSDVDLSTLPPGAQGVLRSAGVVGGFGIPSPTPGLGRGNVPPRLPLVGRSRSAGSVSTGTAEWQRRAGSQDRR
ncbi:hypothetical protein BJ165DRAFT_695596 [Panaeolus papilionaceus]|nr:hypothetical protein BJ165DRAFT_695596 [Panaeolus papilionaceus]